MAKIMLASNGSGYQFEKCFAYDSFRGSIDSIVSDRSCRALDVGADHGVDGINLDEKDLDRLNAAMLETARERGVDYIISLAFTRIFKRPLLDEYEGRVFNCHHSILPAFKGYYDTRDTRRTHPARDIFNRTLEFGSRVTGNTIHVVNEAVDDGHPVIVSTMNIPPEEDPEYTRHRLFQQECQCLMQMVDWLEQGRVRYTEDGYPIVDGAGYEDPGFSPGLERQEIKEFSLPFPY